MYIYIHTYGPIRDQIYKILEANLAGNKIRRKCCSRPVEVIIDPNGPTQERRTCRNYGVLNRDSSSSSSPRRLVQLQSSVTLHLFSVDDDAVFPTTWRLISELSPAGTRSIDRQGQVEITANYFRMAKRKNYFQVEIIFDISFYMFFPSLNDFSSPYFRYKKSKTNQQNSKIPRRNFSNLAHVCIMVQQNTRIPCTSSHFDQEQTPSSSWNTRKITWESINQSINQSNNQSINQSIDHLRPTSPIFIGIGSNSRVNCRHWLGATSSLSFVPLQHRHGHRKTRR